MDGISTYLLTQGVLGFACLVLGWVVVYQQRKLDRKETRIEALQDLRLQDSRDVADKVTLVMSESSQTLRLLSEKIETAKERR